MYKRLPSRDCTNTVDLEENSDLLQNVMSPETSSPSWRLSFPHVLVATISSFLFGYHTGVVNEPLESISVDLGFSGNTLAEGLVVSTCLGGALVGALLSGWIADGVGRRRAFQLCALPMIVGASMRLCGLIKPHCSNQRVKFPIKSDLDKSHKTHHNQLGRKEMKALERKSLKTLSSFTGVSSSLSSVDDSSLLASCTSTSMKSVFKSTLVEVLRIDILRTMQTSEDRSVYAKVVNAIFDEEMLNVKDHHHHAGEMRLAGDDTSIQYTDLDTEVRDCVVEVTREVFRQHCAKHLEIIPMRLLDDSPQFNRKTVKLLTHGGDMLELCHELRLPFVSWVISHQRSSFKRYEISYVYRRAIGHSSPNRYLQGDFDIIGGASALTEAEVIKGTMDIATRFFNPDSCDIHLNHGDLLDAIWSWTGVKAEHRQKVAELLSMMGSLRPQSSERKSKWVVIRRQLLQELNLAEAVVNRLQTVNLRFCGAADQALARLRGALPADKLTRKALDELSDLFTYLRVWRVAKHVYIDALMPPTESYHRDLFFQVYLIKENNPGSLIEGALLAVGGRYDYLLHQMWGHEYKTSPPGAVGTSLALETIIQHSSVDFKPIRSEASTSILVCSRGGGGLLVERMELVAELWEENIKAEFVPTPDPSLTEQYEYANEHDIKCIVILTDTDVSQTGSVKVRHLELKKEKKVQRENLVRFLLEAMTTQFRNPSIWN
nr:eif-2-alpha kinase gcn2 [Quercus suber]